ncbi:MAG: tetrahydrofolate dehydrogenase/cyclohydrolase catalytic domain-containing protein [Candidatus Microgenomates bacterium]|jgi:methylenetetrahydrofolate dehydrogenase (NADP+)/methenyltetrahydrofolate cyclohydrolase
MTAIIFDGRGYAEAKRAELKQKVAELTRAGKAPCMASIYISTDPGSVLYTRLKKQAAESVGIKFTDYDVTDKSKDEIITLIEQINSDKSVQGILVQKPSGKNDFSFSDWSEIVCTIDPRKDIDGLTPENLGLLAIGTPRFVPATVRAVMIVVNQSGIDLLGKKAVIIGASEILGKPLSMILTDKGATVSILHGATRDISNYTAEADLLVSATGNPGLIGAKDIKAGAVVIDVGAPKGDVKTEEVMEKASFLSLVPGGVGPVTISCLLTNLLLKLPLL